MDTTIPEQLSANIGLLTAEEKDLIKVLLHQNQHHLFASWDAPGTNDDKKHTLLKQLVELDQNCGIGGISDYLARARKLLAASKAGENPFDGWTPSVPSGVTVTPFTKAYERYENLGIPHLGKVGFVLVAGGLGERLGYHGIKVELPVETVTKRSYLQHYCQQILAIQHRYAQAGFKLPLAIMVSDDTKNKTEELLERNNYFELDKSQVTLVKQGKVPALISNDAEIALAAPYEVDSKPHGHGDVHALLHSSGTAKKWLENGIEYIVFFQDTNGLSFFSLPATLGVSVDLNLDVNSLAVPRIAKQAIGAIAKLTHTDGREMTVNVEYNQLDPLLRATISAEGDVNDKQTGFSPFPGNINQLLFKLQPYVTVLEETHGQMPEFVNPKYKDASKTYFKKPTRLECMMQDYPKLLLSLSKKYSGGGVGFTNAPAWFCYSPCKNNPTDAAASIANGIPAASPFTAESDQFHVFNHILHILGADVKENPPQTILGITANCLAPRVVFLPSFAMFPHEFVKKFIHPENVFIGKDATVIIDGDVTIDTLRVEGSVHISAVEGTTILVNTKKRVINNAGHVIVLLEELEKSKAKSESALKDVSAGESTATATASVPAHVENPTGELPTTEVTSSTLESVPVPASEEPGKAEEEVTSASETVPVVEPPSEPEKTESTSTVTEETPATESKQEETTVPELAPETEAEATSASSAVEQPTETATPATEETEEKLSEEGAKVEESETQPVQSISETEEHGKGEPVQEKPEELGVSSTPASTESEPVVANKPETETVHTSTSEPKEEEELVTTEKEQTQTPLSVVAEQKEETEVEGPTALEVQATEEPATDSIENPLIAATQSPGVTPAVIIDSTSGETELEEGKDTVPITESDRIRGYLIVCNEMFHASTKDKRREASSNHHYIFDGANVIESEAYEEEPVSAKPTSSSSAFDWCSCFPKF